jgi:hypothetical protein
MSGRGRTLWLGRLDRNGRFRRASPVAVRPGEGLLTERTAGVQPVRRERIFMPHSGHSPKPIAGLSEVGICHSYPAPFFGRGLCRLRSADAIEDREAARQYVEQIFPIGGGLPIFAHRNVRHVLPQLHLEAQCKFAAGHQG